MSVVITKSKQLTNFNSGLLDCQISKSQTSFSLPKKKKKKKKKHLSYIHTKIMKIISKNLIVLVFTLFMVPCLAQDTNFTSLKEFDSIASRYRSCLVGLKTDCSYLWHTQFMRVGEDGVDSVCCDFLKRYHTEVHYRDCTCILSEALPVNIPPFLIKESERAVRRLIFLALNEYDIAEKHCNRTKPAQRHSSNCTHIATAVKRELPKYWRDPFRIYHLSSEDNFVKYNCTEKSIHETREICGFTEREVRRNDTTSLDQGDIVANQCCIDLHGISASGCLCAVNANSTTFSKESKDFVNFMTTNTKVISFCNQICPDPVSTKFGCNPPNCADLKGKTIP